MRILVTGGAGFIGSNFVRRTLQDAYPGLEGAEVVVLDALTYSGNLENLAPVADSPRYSFVHGDIRDTDLLDSILPGVDSIVHFAAESHVDRSVRDSGVFVETNVLGTQRLLDAALRAGTGRFVHVSTDEVYGSIASGSWDEQQPLEPNSPYSASKAGSDLLARSYHRTHGMNLSITRCSNNYGPYHFPEKVIPLFVTNLIDDRHVPLYGEGDNIRDWLHVDDHTRGIAMVLDPRAAPARSTTSAAAPSSPTSSSPSCCWMPRARTGRTSTGCRTGSATTCATASTSPRSAPSSATSRSCRSSRGSPTSCSGTATTARGGSRSRLTRRSEWLACPLLRAIRGTNPRRPR